MATPHIHAELIKQWADGAKIEQYIPSTSTWYHNESPLWWEKTRYRVKPEPTPDIIRYRFMCIDQTTYPTKWRTPNHNIMFVFDGETGELKDAQVLAKE